MNKKGKVEYIHDRRGIKKEILNTWDWGVLAAICEAIERCPDYVSDYESYLYKQARYLRRGVLAGKTRR